MNYQLYQGDCLDVMRTMDANSVDTVVCDPPYALTNRTPDVKWCADCNRVLGGRDGKPDTCPKCGGQLEYQRSQGKRARLYDAQSTFDITAPSTSLARDWHGWGTALKPAYEPIILAMKPLDGTFAQNAGKWGVAGLAIDKGRIGTEQTTTTIKDLSQAHGNQFGKAGITYPKTGEKLNPPGRWPANLILDEEACTQLGEPSRFFYTAKASRREREQGLEGMEERKRTKANMISRAEREGRGERQEATLRNHHPTVKPLSLMRYLVRLTSTPTGGIVLDPFMGSGSTGIAALREGRTFIGIELDADYFQIAQRRIEDAAAQLHLFPQEA